MRCRAQLAMVVAACLAGAAGADDEIPVEIYGPPPPVAPEVITRDDAGRATVRATRLTEPIVVDGRLDDAFYRQTAAYSDFIQQEPHEGELATEQTEAWIFFDDANLYIAARCWDSHPERMVMNEMRRDHDGIYLNENFVVSFDTFYDRRNGLYFQTTPLGAIRDQAITDEGTGRNVDWNTVWDARAARFDGGWTLEMAIPFKSLRYDGSRANQIWGVQMRRVVRWKNEWSYLQPVPAAYGPRGLHRFSEAATLVGIDVPSRTRNIEVKPYGLSSVTTDQTAESPYANDFGGDAGLDAKYGITRSLIADFTYNTDFAQIEEDQQQINLTRFSLFFPEKRDFFLEGQGIFAFGGVQQGNTRGAARRGNANNDLTPILFFSRRIGLTEQGIDPIRVGGRVTGRAGAYRIGALNIQTRGVETAAVPDTNFSVFRLRRDILRRSDIGVIATHRNTSLTELGTGNSVFGFDGNFAFYENLQLNAYYAVSRTPSEEGSVSDDDTSSYTGKLDYSSDRYGLVLEHLKVGDDFRPELGFLRREAFRRNFLQGRFSPRPQSIDWIRRLIFEAELDYVTDNDGFVETRRTQGTLRVEHENGDQTRVELTNNYEFLPEPFEISTGIILPVAGYDFLDINFVHELGPQRKVPSTVTFRTGGFFSGDRREVSYEGRVELTPQFSVEPRVSFNWVDLAEGSFTAKLASARVSYTFTPRAYVSSFLQYNSSSDALSASIRFRWEYEPGSDLFVVYSEGRNDLSFQPFLATRTLAVKLTKLFRF